MSIYARHKASLDWLAEGKAAREYANRYGFELTRDTQKGFWLKDGELRRFIPYVRDVAGWVDYLRHH